MSRGSHLKKEDANAIPSHSLSPLRDCVGGTCCGRLLGGCFPTSRVAFHIIRVHRLLKTFVSICFFTCTLLLVWATVFADAWGFCLCTLHSDAHSRTRRCPAPTSRIPRRANKLGIGAVHVRGPKRLRAVHRGKWPTPFHSGHRRHLSCRKAATFAHGCSPNIQFSFERATRVM